MKTALITLALLLSIQFSWAQFKFLANNCSNQYNAKIFVAACSDGHCDGKSTIILYDKISEKELQTFNSADLDFSLTAKQDARIGWLELGKYQSPITFGDFNFDGTEDLAIRNGSNGAYGSPSFDIYLSSRDGKFTLDKTLTKLASENLGMFDADKNKKQISIEQKSGCCYHKTTSYSLEPKKGLTEVSSVIEDATIGDDVVVITQKLIAGKMQRTIQKFKTKEYYSEQ